MGIHSVALIPFFLICHAVNAISIQLINTSIFDYGSHDFNPWRADGIPLPQKGPRTDGFWLFAIIDGKLYYKPHGQDERQRRFYFAAYGILNLIERHEIPNVIFLYSVHDGGKIRRDFPYPWFTTWKKSMSGGLILWPCWLFWGDILKERRSESVRPQLPWSSLFHSMISQQMQWRVRQSKAIFRGSYRRGLRESLFRCGEMYPNLLDVKIAGWDDKSTKNIFNGKPISALDRCKYKYILVVDGSTESTGMLHAVGCGSVVLKVESSSMSFWSRALQAGVHYISIPSTRHSICTRVLNAISWSKEQSKNRNMRNGEEISNKLSLWVKDNLNMTFVYKYMAAQLETYASLQQFEPTLSRGYKRLTLKSLLACMHTWEKKHFLKIIYS